MAKTRLTIALVCSHGGHLTEMLHLMPAVEGHDTFFFCYDAETTRALPNAHRVPNMARNPIELVKNLVRLVQLFARERPDLIVSTGAEIAIPAVLVGKLFGAKTFYVECGAQVTKPSFTGRLMYHLADQFHVQWPELLAAYGPKARLRGSFIDAVAPFPGDHAYEARGAIVLLIPPAAVHFARREAVARLGALLQQRGFTARVVDAPGEGLSASRTVLLLDEMSPAAIVFAGEDPEMHKVLQHVSRAHTPPMAAWGLLGPQGYQGAFDAGDVQGLLAWAESLTASPAPVEPIAVMPAPDWELFYVRPPESRR